MSLCCHSSTVVLNCQEKNFDVQDKTGWRGAVQPPGTSPCLLYTSCGTPVLASPVGGIPDVIQDGQTGWFLKEPSTEGIERQLRTILEENRLKEISAAAQAYALRAFSYEEVLEDFRKGFIKPGE